MEEKKSIFRKSALERISSPEDLDKYLAVTGPGIWFPLLAVVVLLIGVFAWTIFGRLDTKIDVAVVSDESGVVCYLPYENSQNGTDDTIIVADSTYEITDDGLAVQLVTDENLALASGLPQGSPVKPMRVNADLPYGTYKGKITVEVIKPITFITN